MTTSAAESARAIKAIGAHRATATGATARRSALFALIIHTLTAHLAGRSVLIVAVVITTWPTRHLARPTSIRPAASALGSVALIGPAAGAIRAGTAARRWAIIVHLRTLSASTLRRLTIARRRAIIVLFDHNHATFGLFGVLRPVIIIARRGRL
ncbi:MAG: hypothetical protein JSR77_07660 [Planctomycetes bacterium]|nr:hypothetical protein [Planctomycetota bacterium]